MWNTRSRGGFNRNQSNGIENDSSSRNVHDDKIKPRLSWKMKNQAQNAGRHKLRKMDHMIEGINTNFSDTVQNASTKINNSKSNDNLRCTPWNNPSCGYKITIMGGQEYPKEYIVNYLQNLIAPDELVPIMYQNEKRAAVFYVDEKSTCEKLMGCYGQITGESGNNLPIYTVQKFPHYKFDQRLRDKITDAIVKKYVEEKSALDMSRFHHNPDLVNDYFCSLTRVPIVATALRVVAEVFPYLVELRLDKNQLYDLENLELLTALPKLEILSLCDNKIGDLKQVDPLSVLNLAELRLAGNPVCENYEGRQAEYISAIRNKLPNLTRLDGVVLRASIHFDIPKDLIVLPRAHKLFSPNANVVKIATDFLRLYFSLFDTENRAELLNAYHENASFSLTFSVFPNDDRWSNYIPHNRDLCEVRDESKRRNLLTQGGISILAWISKLPKTQHDLDSFTLDIGLATETLIVMTVTGTFKEIEANSENIRYFSRTYALRSIGHGHCIINEMLHISKPTKQQVQAFGTIRSTGWPNASPEMDIPENVREQMTAALREVTRMTLKWATKCLEEVGWDYEKAITAFQRCHQCGIIPPDAFEK